MSRTSHLTGHAVLPIAVGACLYLLCRQPTMLVFRAVDGLGLDEALMAARSRYAAVLGELPDWVVFSAPNGLWLYAFLTCMCEVWRAAPDVAGSRVWRVVPGIIGLGFEAGQWAAVVPGTFDPTDVSCMLAAIGLHAWVNQS